MDRPLLLPAPLTSPADLIATLAACTGDSPETARRRFLEESRCSGVNVRRDAEAFGLVPYVWSDRLIQFYGETPAFLYETAAWNRSPLKQSIRAWIATLLQRHVPTGGRVLVYGDGLGFDSACLAALGYTVTSLEPSHRGQQFAVEVFKRNNVAVRQIAGDEEVPAEPFDAIVCLDVLEHVPAPPDTLRQFDRWLKPEGILAVAAPFFCIEPYRPTHLASNRKYSGSLSLFRKFGFRPLAGKYMWDPIAFRKGRPGRFADTLFLRLGQPLIVTGRWLWPIHSQVARWMLRPERGWLRQLEGVGAG